MIKQQFFAIGATVFVLTGIGAAGGYWSATRMHPQAGMAPTANQNPATEKSADKAMYWFDPMFPAQHFDKPGPSPFMDMQLVPKYADEKEAGGGAHIDPLLSQNTGVKFATVETGRLAQAIEATASVGFNERLVAVVQARSGGIVERVYARAPNDVIAAGTALADVRVPEWYGAQAEYLALHNSGDAQLAAAARSRLQQLGMSETQIAQTEKTGEPQAMLTVYAPLSGMLQEIGVRQGMIVMPGQMFARINGIGSVWLEAEVPEAQATELAIGMKVSATFAAWPERQFSARITALLPELNRDARTIRVRVELPNPDGKLRPGMYARVKIDTTAGRDVLLVPSEALITTGQRSLVIVAQDDSHFRPAEVQIGREANGKTEIITGLKQGEKIVAAGQFLIDSEASLSGVLARMETAAKPDAMSMSMSKHDAQGTIEAVSANEVTISHGPVPTLNWGPMTMPFKLADPKLVQGIKVGDKVGFTFHQDDAGVTIEHLQKTGDGQ